MKEMLIVLPYQNLAHNAQVIAGKMGIDCETHSYDDANLPREEEDIDCGKFTKTRVIVSRGGIAKAIRKKVDVPLIEVPVTSFDLLDAISQVANKGYKRISVVTASNIIFKSEHISQIKGLKIEFHGCETLKESVTRTKDIIKRNAADSIIGDTLTHLIARENNVFSVRLESSYDSVEYAIQEAKKILEAFKREKAHEIECRKVFNNKGWIAKFTFNDIIGHSEQIIRVKALAQRFSRIEGNILIYGETGTGKELFAQGIHNQSNRTSGPFVSINCGALNESLLESELFGYDSGAFTGALKGGKKGLCECANQGTLFLDEISETSLNFQAKLLRVLQERKIRKVGGEESKDVDIRIICATNKDPYALVDKKLLREDLYYRICELELRISPLRDRKSDIITIAKNLIENEMERIKFGSIRIHWQDDNVFEPLLNYDWPGNVRELRNFIVKLITYNETDEITKRDVKQVLNNHTRNRSFLKETKITLSLNKDLKAMEAEMIREILVHHYHGNKEKFCTELGVSPTTLWRKLNYNLNSTTN